MGIKYLAFTDEDLVVLYSVLTVARTYYEEDEKPSRVMVRDSIDRTIKAIVDKCELIRGGEGG